MNPKQDELLNLEHFDKSKAAASIIKKAVIHINAPTFEIAACRSNLEKLASEIESGEYIVAKRITITAHTNAKLDQLAGEIKKIYNDIYDSDTSDGILFLERAIDAAVRKVKDK